MPGGAAHTAGIAFTTRMPVARQPPALPSPVAGSLLVLAGTACILITLLWANLSSLFAGLHSYAR